MGLRILLVEDHDDTRYVISRLLRHFGYTVVTASVYQSASKNLDQSRFDVLVSDISLPDGDGCDLVKEAKSKQPVMAVATTALGHIKHEERCLSSGFDHYLVKPLSAARLRLLLSQIRMQSN